MKKLQLNANLPESVSFELNSDYYQPEPEPNLEYSRFSDVVDITGLSDDEVEKLERGWFVDRLMEMYFYSEIKWGVKEQANKWKSQIDIRAYEALMNYQVEIDD